MPKPNCILVTGGLPGEPKHAIIGDTVLHREAGEALAMFQDRAVAAGEAAGVAHVVIGGLPLLEGCEQK